MDKVIPTIRNFYMNTIFLCKEKGILIGELEKKVGISPGYLSRLCSESKQLSVFKAYRIAQILEYNLVDMLEKEIWKPIRIKELEAELEALKGGER